MRKFLNPKAFTLLEITIVTAVLLVLLGTTISLIAPSNSKGRSRDARRMSDISNLDRALNEYKLDFALMITAACCVSLVYAAIGIPLLFEYAHLLNALIWAVMAIGIYKDIPTPHKNELPTDTH